MQEDYQQRIAAVLRQPQITKALIASRAGVHPNTLRDMDRPDWNPALRTFLAVMAVVEKIEAMPPPSQADMFVPRYPDAPGFKDGDTSRDAAKRAEPSAKILRQRILDELRAGPTTADEMASRLGLTVLSVRPRFSELRNKGQIEDTGERRRNDSGCQAKVWRRSVPQAEG